MTMTFDTLHHGRIQVEIDDDMTGVVTLSNGIQRPIDDNLCFADDWRRPYRISFNPQSGVYTLKELVPTAVAKCNVNGDPLPL